MLDTIFTISTLVFFVLSVLYVKFCDGLRKRQCSTRSYPWRCARVFLSTLCTRCCVRKSSDHDKQWLVPNSVLSSGGSCSHETTWLVHDARLQPGEDISRPGPAPDREAGVPVDGR